MKRVSQSTGKTVTSAPQAERRTKSARRPGPNHPTSRRAGQQATPSRNTPTGKELPELSGRQLLRRAPPKLPCPLHLRALGKYAPCVAERKQASPHWSPDHDIGADPRNHLAANPGNGQVTLAVCVARVCAHPCFSWRGVCCALQSGCSCGLRACCTPQL